MGDPRTFGPITSRLDNYFNPDAFSKPPTDVRGTAPRTLNYRGPGIRTLDAVLIKNISLRREQRLQFRVEAQNVLNHPIFGDPNNTSYGSTAFGQITTTKIGPRQVMLGLKYYF